MQEKENLSKVVYTAISDNKDRLTNGQCKDGAVFVAYLDEATNPDKLAVNGDWYIRRLKSSRNKVGQNEDPVRQAKQPKVAPHRVLYGAEQIQYSLWIDGNMRLKVPMQVLIDKYLNDCDIALFAHPLRDCIYDEAQVCRQFYLDDVITMEYQIKKYERENYPKHNGLIDGSIILRRHTKEVEEINDLWWKEIMNGSRRDQLSFNYVMWKLGRKYKVIDGFNHVKTNEYFEATNHFREKNL